MDPASLVPQGWTVGPTVLPALVAYLLASPASLRAWIAVQALAAPAPLEVKDTKVLKRRRIAHCLAFFTVIFGVEYYLISAAGTTVVSSVLLVIGGLFTQIALMTVFGDLSGAFRWAAYRAGTGILWRLAPGTVSHWRTALVVLLSGAINAQTLIEPGACLSAIVTSALVYHLVSGAKWRSISIRGIMLLLISWIALSFVLSGVLIALLVHFQKQSQSDEPSDDAPVEIVATMFSRNVEQLTQLITGAFFAAGPGVLIAACYRFDHAHHLSHLSLPFPTPESVERRLCPSRRRRATTSATPAPGTLVPSAAPTGFSRPLYLTALFSWLAVQAGITTLFALAPFPAEVKADQGIRDLAALALTVPTMVVTVLVGAWVSGRAKEMWCYREVWVVRPTVMEVGGIRLEDEEESVPPYQEAEEAAPEYEVEVKA